MASPEKSSATPKHDINVGDKEVKETNQVTANFSSSEKGLLNTKTQSSPLLSSTPPTVSKALIRAYPYLLIVNKFLSIITWTNDDYWVNIIIICSFSLSVLYFEILVTWFGHLIIVGFITLYALLNNKILEEANLHPTLDEVVHALTNTCLKADRLLDPIISLSLTGYDIKRLLFTTVFLTPLYLIITFLIIKPRIILLIIGLYLLTYHSSYSVISRKMIWKIKLTRVLFFYLTGLDFSKQRNHSLFAAAFAKVQKNANYNFNPLNSENNRPVRFTYVIYENQRRWLGIGWTSNLLSYERTPWTDEFLNESSSIDSFSLPNPENHQDYTFGQEQSSQLSINNAKWRWVDKTWRLDLTNDGAISLNSKRAKTTANPNSDDGFIYYDNTWKRPSTEDSYSKYTRRRRWIRTAELVFDEEEEINGNNSNATSNTFDESMDTTIDDSSKKVKKSLRFAEPDTKDNVSPSVSEKEENQNSKEVSNILEKLDIAPEKVTKEVLDPVLTDDIEIEDIKPVNPISDSNEPIANSSFVDDKKNE